MASIDPAHHFPWCDPEQCANDLDEAGRIWIHTGATTVHHFADDSGDDRHPFTLELSHCADPEPWHPSANTTLVYVAGWMLRPDEARTVAADLSRLATLVEGEDVPRLSAASQRELDDYVRNLRTMGRFSMAAVRRYAEDLARRDAGGAR